MNQDSICDHASKTITLRTIANGATCVVPQCDQCGTAFPSLPKAGHDLTKLPPFDPEKNEIWRGAIWLCRKAVLDADREDRKLDWWASYTVYLQSENWQHVRRIVLARDTVCQCCFRERSNEAHHLSYATFRKSGFSFPQECVGVCSRCHHEKIHPEVAE